VCPPGPEWQHRHRALLTDLEFDAQSGRITGKLGGQGNFARCRNEEVTGMPAESGINLAGRRCSLDLTLGAEGTLAGSFVAENRYRHEVTGSLR
jgi:hypothetical protein